MADGLEAELRVVGEVAEFVVTAYAPGDQAAIVKLGWWPAGDSTFVRRLAAPPEVDVVFANFVRHLDAMVRHTAGTQASEWEAGLGLVLNRLADAGVDWWLYGSGALAVRGLDVWPRDLDLAVDDPMLVAHVLRDVLVEPVTGHGSWVARWTGRAFHGAIIEWLADAYPTGRTLPSEQEPAVREHLEVVEWRGHEIRVPSLQVQLATAHERGLTERVDLIRLAIGV